MKTAPQPRLGDPTFWCAVGLVLFALFFSFRSFVIREVAWASTQPTTTRTNVPRNCATSAYRDHVVETHGFWAAMSALYRGASVGAAS